MAIHKGDFKGPSRLILMILPVLCLLAYAARLPLPLPRIFLPHSDYEAASSTTEAILKDSAARFGSVRIHSGDTPTLADIQAAERHYAATGMPVAFETARDSGPPGPIAAYSMNLSGDGTPSVLTILLGEASSGPVTVTAGGVGVLTVEAAPADRRVSVPIAGRAGGMAADEGGAVTVGLTAGSPGSASSGSITVLRPEADRPRVLMATRRLAARSVLEALRPVRKIPYDELGSAGLYAYELLVLDGPVLSELEGGLAAALAEYVKRGAGSLLVVVDSPAIGKPGDSPAIEDLLPVELSPRSLSRLPDVAMAVAIDVSGSMYGDKLSLAKAVGLELVANLKPGDLAGILLFDDETRWLYPLAPVADLDARQTLAPLRAGGGTRMHPALAECIAALEASGLPEKRIIVVSDGISAPADFDALAARAFASGIAISAMAVGAEYDEALLTRIAAGSGGRFYRVRDASQVPSLIIEDRKSISRTVFAEESIRVVDIAGNDAGSIGGMARLGPKPDAVAFFSSAAGDPLFASRRVGARSTLVYASDVYGGYGADFLMRPATISVLAAVIDGLFSERPPAATLTETADGLALSIRADDLVQPYAALADERGRIVHEGPFERVSPGRFHAALGKPGQGRYTALVEDRGRTVARFALYSNGGTEAAPSDSAAAALAYRTPFWALPRGGAPWLIAFFALSLLGTLLLRIRR